MSNVRFHIDPVDPMKRVRVVLNEVSLKGDHCVAVCFVDNDGDSIPVLVFDSEGLHFVDGVPYNALPEFLFIEGQIKLYDDILSNDINLL